MIHLKGHSFKVCLKHPVQQRGTTSNVSPVQKLKTTKPKTQGSVKHQNRCTQQAEEVAEDVVLNNALHTTKAKGKSPLLEMRNTSKITLKIDVYITPQRVSYIKNKAGHGQPVNVEPIPTFLKSFYSTKKLFSLKTAFYYCRVNWTDNVNQFWQGSQKGRACQILSRGWVYFFYHFYTCNVNC